MEVEVVMSEELRVGPTPEPWYVADKGGEVGAVMAGDEIICFPMVPAGAEPFELRLARMRANARLMASSLDLLKACRAVRAVSIHIAEHQCFSGQCATREALGDAAYVEVEAALAKAGSL